MAIIDVAANFAILQDCWFPHALNLALQQLSAQERQQAIAWINTQVFDAALALPTGHMNVTEALRHSIPNHPDWNGTALQALYDRTGSR
ncbi:MAG: hypothetical protein ACREFQ_06395 [Stellaceae bacterium]